MGASAVAARALESAPLRQLLRQAGRWTGTLVLVYHRIGDASDSPLNRSLFSAGIADFDDQLAVLEREADVVAIDSLLEPRSRKLGRRVAITFDDGYRDTGEVAWPLLRARGLPATLFLATGFIDRPRLAWWDELAWVGHRAGWDESRITRFCTRYAAMPANRADGLIDEVARATGGERPTAADADGVWLDWEAVERVHREGLAIGGHTVDHPVLSRVEPERLEAEIEGCRETLARRLDLTMRMFSYPLGGPGDHDPRAHDPLRRAGVELAFACAGGVALPGHDDPMAMPRACAPLDDHTARMRAMVGLPRIFARW